VAWRINAERLVVLGWTRAILLQFAHPLIAAGVHEHSGFRQSPLAAVRRLRHTIKAMLALTFGGASARERTLTTIRGIHRRVNGTLASAAGPFVAGTPYSAEDPALLLWVHLTLIESIVVTYELLAGSLTERERDSYCAESASVAIALGAVDADVPRTWGALQAILDRTYRSGVIAVSAEAKALAIAVTRPSGSMLTGPVMWLNEVLAVGLLPAHVRQRYGFRWNRFHGWTFRAIIHALRMARRLAPDVIALWREARRDTTEL
jgi:uncharacterized protein (DUF2236 family)